MNGEFMVGGALIALCAAAGGVMVREAIAKARFDRRLKAMHADTLQDCVVMTGRVYSSPAVAIEPKGDLAQAMAAGREEGEALRAAGWQALRARMFPPSLQHYWVPNGAIPGPDGRWWVFLGATRTIWGFTDREDAVAHADAQNSLEGRGKYHPGRASGVMVPNEGSDAFKAAFEQPPEWAASYRYADLGHYRKDGTRVGIDFASGSDETVRIASDGSRYVQTVGSAEPYVTGIYDPEARDWDAAPQARVLQDPNARMIVRTPGGGTINAAGEYDPLSDVPGAHYEAIGVGQSYRVALTAPDRPAVQLPGAYTRLRDAKGAATKLNRAEDRMIINGKWDRVVPIAPDAIKRTKNG